MSAALLWTITTSNFNRAFEICVLWAISILLTFLGQSDGMLYGRWQLLLPSQSCFKQLLSESLTDKFHYYLCQCASAFLFAHFLLIEGYRKCALRKEPVTTPFVEQFKTATLRKSYWWIPFVLTVICLTISFLFTFCW